MDSDSLFLILTIVFIIASVAMILIILVQRPQGGGLAGAFGGAGGGGTEGVFGGRVGDALTVMTVVGFCIYLLLAILLNANIWTPDSTAIADEAATDPISQPAATTGGASDAAPPLDTGFEPAPVTDDSVEVEFTPEGEATPTTTGTPELQTQSGGDGN